MAYSTIIIGVVFLLIVSLYKFIIAPAFLSPLSKIPNAHFSAPLTSLWIQSKRRTCAATRTIYSLHQKHGPIVRLGPNELSACTPNALKTIYIGGFAKDPWYLDAFVNYGEPNLVSMLEHKPHSVQKRMISNLYSKSYLHGSVDLQKASKHLILERFLPIIQSVADNGIEMDVLDFFQGVGMDFTSAYLFGLTNGSNFMHNVDYRRHWIQQYQLFKGQLPQQRLGCEVEQWCMSMCKAAESFLHSDLAKEDPLATQPVVYGRLAQQFRESTKAADSQLEMAAVASEMLDHLIAGHETSGITLSYLMYELSQRPDLQQRLRNELLTLSPPVVHPHDENAVLPSARSIDSLPLLDSILQETLRLYAAAPAMQARITPHTPTGTTLEGYSNIPGGIRVAANAYTLHRNATVYPEPLKWIPERWMDAKPEHKEEMKRWFWAFGSGGRMCLGSNFAIQDMKLVTAAVYTNYTTEIVDDEGIEQADTYVSGPVGEKLILRFRHV